MIQHTGDWIAVDFDVRHYLRIDTVGVEQGSTPQLVVLNVLGTVAIVLLLVTSSQWTQVNKPSLDA
jgi:hypothetical protein